MRAFTCAAALFLSIVPALAQQGAAGAGSGSQGAGGNGITTSSSSGPEAKTGAERSPTGGAPTDGSGTAASGPNSGR